MSGTTFKMAEPREHEGYKLRVKLKRNHDQLENKEEKIKRVNRERYMAWKWNMKMDPEKYLKHKEKDAENHRKYRKTMNEEQRKKYNEKAKDRMRRYRFKKTEDGVDRSDKKTRQQIKIQREYWRKKKREQRLRMSEEQIKERNEQRRKQYHEKKAKKRLDFEMKSESKGTGRHIRIPVKPDRFADSVNNLMSNCTPRKHRELMKRGVLLSPNTKKKYDTYTKIVTKVKLHLKDLKKSQTARGRQHYYLITKGLVGKHYIEKSIREALDLKYNYWARLCHLHEEPLPITTKVSDETKENIKSFYIDESENLPTQRMATKKVLTETLKTTYKRFVGKGYEQKVSLSTFIKQRPKQVLTMNMNKFQSCLCEYCVNVEFKLEALGRECVAEDLSELKLDNKYECLKMTLCPSDKEVGKKECYERECLRCGEESICLHFSQLVDKCGDRTVRWKRWELGSVGRPEKKEKRQMLVEKEGTVLDLLKQLTDELKPFAKHIFTASWQRKQYQQLIKNLPNDCVVTVMDFAENYRCVNQDEIQSAYYNYSQATLFPCVVHYKCPDCPNAIVEESAVFITPDLKHDSDAVQNFTKKLDEYLKETVSFSREIQFSDGCAAQFKSKTPFTHISEETNHVIERCFFGSRHGKSCCDGLGGLVKSQATKYVRNRKGTIPNAKALYDFCQENLAEKAEEKCSHKKRSFFYVENIQRDLKSEKLMTLPGTRALHNVKAVSPGIVKVRSLACFCHACVSEDDKVKCTNEHIVGNWITRSLRREQKVTNPNQKGVKERKNKRKKKSKPKRSSKCKVKNVKYQCRVDDKTNEQPKKADHINPKESKKKDKSDDMSESNEQKCNGQRENRDIFRNCTTFLKLKRAVQTAEFTQLPFDGNKSYSNTNKIVDNNSLPLVPDDIPLQPTHQLFPCVIYGDGNCLPRAASVYAYGTENNHADMRRRIVKELVENETRYLDNKYMRRGKHPDGDDDVTRTFAMYSDHYMANKQLTPELIRTIYRNEIMTVKERGKWMGLWQIASLANILRRPVVSVTPEHGSFNTRKDMHRVFYPFDDYGEQTPVFFMWTNINGVTEEREFVLNHFTAMMPLTEGVTFSDDECENSPTDCLPGEWIFDNDILNQNIESLIPDEGLSVGSEDTRTDEDTTSSGVEVTTKDAPVPAAGASADNVDQEDNTENESINFQDVCNEPSNGIDVTNADTPVPSQTADEPLEGNTTNNTNISKDKCNDSSAESLVTSRDTAGLFTEEVKVQGEVTDNIASTFRGKYYESSKGTDTTSTDSFVIGYEEGRSEGVDMTDGNNHYESIAKESSIRTESTITGDSEIGPVEDTSDEVEKGDDDDHFEDIDTKSSIRTESTITCDSEIGPVEGTKEEIDKGDDYDHFEDIDTKSSPMINTNMGDTFSTAEDKGSEGNNVEISSHKDDESSPMINTNMGDTFSTAKDKGSEGNNVEISSHKDDESSPMINTNMGDTFSTAEDKGSEGNNVEISSHKDDESRYNAGDYILIKHGRNHIPGIVDSWPWVKYFYKKKDRWLLNDMRYIIIPTDVVRKLGPPEFYGVGTRMYYKFEIGSYDKQLWEQSVEQKVLKGIQQAPRRSVKPKTELIDVDLVRGSTFSKVKPQVPWTYITIKTFSRVVLFPFHYRWWIQQTSLTFWIFLMFLYSLQIFTIFVFLCNVEVEVFGDEHSLSEVFTPCVLMVLLGMIHSQTVLTHLKPPVRDNKRAHHHGNKPRRLRDSWRRKRSLSQNRSGSDIIVNSTGVGSDGNSSQSKTNLKNPHNSRLLRERTKDRKIRLKGSRSNIKPDAPSQDSESAYHTYEESTLEKGSSADVDSVSSVGRKDDDNIEGNPDQSTGLKRRCESQESDLPEDSNSEDDCGKNDLCDKENCKRFSQSISSDNEIEFDSVKNIEDSEQNNETIENSFLEKDKKFVSTLEINPDSSTKNGTSKDNLTEGSLVSIKKEDIKKVVRSDLNVKLEFEGPSFNHKDINETRENPANLRDNTNANIQSIQTQNGVKHNIVPKSDEAVVRFSAKDSARQASDEDDSLFKNLASRKHVNKREIVSVNRKYFSSSNGLNSHKNHDTAFKSTDCEYSSLSSLDKERSPIPAHIASSVHFTLDKQREATPKGSRESTPTHTQSDVILQAKHARGGNLSTKSSDSESEDNEKTCKSLPNVRRRKVTLQDGSEVSGSILRNRRQPGSLGIRDTKSSTTVVSSSEGETEGQSSEYSRESRRNMASSEEWGDHLQSGLDTTSESSSCGSEPEISTQEVPEPESENESPASPQPHGVSVSTAQVINLLHPSSSQSTTHSPPDKVTCIIWEGNECKKIELTAIDIGWTIIETVHKIPESSDYVLIGITFSILMGLTPLLYHSFHAKDIASIMTWNGVYQVLDIMTKNSWSENLIHLNGLVQRLCLSAIFFFMLSVADKTFKQRLLYAKHFCYLTSSRRARKFDMPHFRLNKVRNIRSWLSLRSYLKKRGPQRSVDVIVSSSFLITLIMLILICLQLLRDTEIYLNYLCNWELLVWCMALGVYLLRFMNLGLRINKKYRNLSVLITEQINLYLQMEQKPHKKEELMVANNVLKLAESLLKELESPFKISGISANPLVLNITRVVVLSAFSAVLTELLGFKLKLYKIKLRP